MSEHNKTRRNSERETERPKTNPTGPTTREEMLRDDLAFDMDLAGVGTPSRAGGHMAQSVGSRDQEQSPFQKAGGHGRLEKKDEKPWNDRTPPKKARSPS